MALCGLAVPQSLAVGVGDHVGVEQLAAEIEVCETETRIWSICLDHEEWVQAMASRYFASNSPAPTAAENTSPGASPSGADGGGSTPHLPSESHGPSRVLESLVNVANRETKEIKRMIFRQIRCHHCKQGGHPGGNKADIELTLPAIQVQWLRQVSANCGHDSVDKTMRIILDFYPSLTNLKDGEALERKLFVG